MDVLLQCDVDAFLVGGLEQHQGRGLEACEKNRRDVAAADVATFVLDREMPVARRHLFHQRDREAVLEIDLGGLRLRMMTEGRAAVMGQSLEIDLGITMVQQAGLADAGASANHDWSADRAVLFDLVEQEASHRLVAAAHPGAVDPGFLEQPALAGLRAHAAAETVQYGVRVTLQKVLPLPDALCFQFPADQLFTQFDRLILALVLVSDADPVSFVVVDQRMVLGGGKGTVGKLYRCAHIQQRDVVEEKPMQIIDFLQFCRHGRCLLAQSVVSGGGKGV